MEPEPATRFLLPTRVSTTPVSLLPLTRVDKNSRHLRRQGGGMPFFGNQDAPSKPKRDTLERPRESTDHVRLPGSRASFIDIDIVYRAVTILGRRALLTVSFSGQHEAEARRRAFSATKNGNSNRLHIYSTFNTSILCNPSPQPAISGPRNPTFIVNCALCATNVLPLDSRGSLMFPALSAIDSQWRA